MGWGNTFKTKITEQTIFVYMEFKVNLLSPAKGERYRAVGKVKKPDKNITVTEGELFSHEESGQILVATMVATVMSVYDREGIKNY